MSIKDTDVDDMPALTPEQWASMISSVVRRRIIDRQIMEGDVAKLRAFVQLTREELAAAMMISVDTLCDWEESRSMPEGPAVALLAIAARHPRIIREAAKRLQK